MNRPYFTPHTMQFLLQKYKCIAVQGKKRIAYDKPSFNKIGGMIYKIHYDKVIYYVFTTNTNPLNN